MTFSSLGYIVGQVLANHFAKNQKATGDFYGVFLMCLSGLLVLLHIQVSLPFAPLCTLCSQWDLSFPGPPRSGRLRNNTRSPGCKLGNRTFRSYCFFPSSADLEIFCFRQFIGIFHCNSPFFCVHCMIHTCIFA